MSIISKTALIERINNNLKKEKLTKAQVELVVNEFLEETKNSLIQGEEIRLVGYYNLKTATQKARIAMNLQTKQKMTVPAKRVPKIKFSDVLKAEIANHKISKVK